MNRSMKELTKTAMMAAIIFVCTYTLKVPNVITGGYTHLGDCGIFVAVLLLGRRNGSMAAAVGGAMADLLGGYWVYVIPTFLIKGIMAYIMGTITEKLGPGHRFGWLAGAVPGGVSQVIGYALVEGILKSPEAAILTIPANTAQTFCGIVIAAVVILALQTSRMLNRIKEL